MNWCQRVCLAKCPNPGDDLNVAEVFEDPNRRIDARAFAAADERFRVEKRGRFTYIVRTDAEVSYPAKPATQLERRNAAPKLARQSGRASAKASDSPTEEQIRAAQALLLETLPRVGDEILRDNFFPPTERKAANRAALADTRFTSWEDADGRWHIKREQKDGRIRWSHDEK